MSSPFEREVVDEMPEAPETTGAFDASLLADVKKISTLIKEGVYKVKIVEWELKFPAQKEDDDEDDSKKKKRKEYHFDDGTKIGVQPYYNCTLSVQQEPYLGTKLWQMVSWCSDDVWDAAKRGDKGAQTMINNRLSTAKEIMAAANFNATGAANFNEFLDSQPEFRVKVRNVPKRVQDAKGKWVATSEKRSEVGEILPPMKGR